MNRGPILPDRRRTRIAPPVHPASVSGRTRVVAFGRRAARIAVLLCAPLCFGVLAGCFPRYDWRDYRPDCAVTWCGFTASFPGRVSTATRDVPVGAVPLPLALHVVSVGDVTFAVGAFELKGTPAAAARAVFETKLLADLGTTDARRSPATMRAVDRGEIAAEGFEADGRRGDRPSRAVARFGERNGRLVEILVIGPVDVLSTASGRQAVETFVTSLRLD